MKNSVKKIHWVTLVSKLCLALGVLNEDIMFDFDWLVLWMGGLSNFFRSVLAVLSTGFLEIYSNL